MDTITTLLEQHREALAGELKSSLSTLDSKFDQIQSTVEDHGQRISSPELATDDQSQLVVELEHVRATLREDNPKLKTKDVDLEGRSMDQNIHILGFSPAYNMRCLGTRCCHLRPKSIEIIVPWHPNLPLDREHIL